ncbi:hypothetical protein CFC21_065283 [Triticum aestivum]|uniref:UspA domain-containing protein n=3 Tax=Triticum TaxID=4564 RepID=A0A9R0WMH7_TRITD|nr:universal stress protein A-like protein isoform X1 [Triticum aestivum]KAF7058161.1 hypothetical protein CFC21_065283 [Triticum aestivum]VAI16128.1 unnamed protein product [Triticum turgidum subsp. durum]
MKVVVALDDSGGSHHALDWVLRSLFPAGDQPATEEARHELVLVHALEPLHHAMCPVGGPGSAVYGAPEIMQSVRAARKESARSLLDRARRVCHGRGVSAAAVLVEGESREALCRAAEDAGAGLLVVGSRGLGAVGRCVTAFLGSVSDYCAHHASCPVMVVRPPPVDKDGQRTRSSPISCPSPCLQQGCLMAE